MLFKLHQRIQIYQNFGFMRSGKLYQFDQPTSYQPLWHWQQQLVQQRIQDPNLADLVILTEHLPVYTFGRGADLTYAKFDLADPKIEWHRVERGGEVTFHAPGQIVGYPILNLNFYQRDLHWYLRQLEEVLILTLAEFGIVGERRDRLTGVWVNERKIAQIGIKCSRWITMHGFALNVNLDLGGFERIVPCGISDRTCCKMSEFVPGLEVTPVRSVVAHKFTEVFNLELRLSLPSAIYRDRPGVVATALAYSSDRPFHPLDSDRDLHSWHWQSLPQS